MSQNLKNTALSATAWSALGTFCQQDFQFVIWVILARLIAPADFGWIAMLAVLIASGWRVIASFSGNSFDRKYKLYEKKILF